VTAPAHRTEETTAKTKDLKFTKRDIGSIYGMGCSPVVRPDPDAGLRESTGRYRGPLQIIAIIMLLSAILLFFLRPLAQKCRTRKP
jgi:hypothetical protein